VSLSYLSFKLSDAFLTIILSVVTLCVIILRVVIMSVVVLRVVAPKRLHSKLKKYLPFSNSSGLLFFIFAIFC
jgi:hypothetical protein